MEPLATACFYHTKCFPLSLRMAAAGKNLSCLIPTNWQLFGTVLKASHAFRNIHCSPSQITRPPQFYLAYMEMNAWCWGMARYGVSASYFFLVLFDGSCCWSRVSTCSHLYQGCIGKILYQNLTWVFRRAWYILCNFEVEHAMPLWWHMANPWLEGL